MVDQELSERITQLPVDARLELIEVLTHSLRSHFVTGVPDLTERVAQEAISPDHTTHQSTSEERVAAFNRLFGALNNDSRPPTDEEWKEDYTTYLTRKYE